MGRRKQVEEAVLETPIEENLDEVEVEETEAVEEELSAEATEETPAETEEVKAEEVVAEEPKPKRQRRARKPRTPQLSVENAAEPVNEISEETNYKEDMKVAAVAMQKSMESMVKQWNTIKEISAQVSSNLEKVSNKTKPEPNYMDTQDLIRPQMSQPQFITKFATAASIVAVILSLVSLSLSQSARQVALNAEVTRATQKNSELATLPFEPAKKGTDYLAFPKKFLTKTKK